MAEKYYRIGDAAELLGLKTYVLRYWESEFPELRPVRTGKGQRRYTEADVALLGRIRCLLHEEGLTIDGARRVLAGDSGLSLGGGSEFGSGAEADTVPRAEVEDTRPVQLALLPIVPRAPGKAQRSVASLERTIKAAAEQDTLAHVAAELRALKTLLRGT